MMVYEGRNDLIDTAPFFHGGVINAEVNNCKSLSHLYATMLNGDITTKTIDRLKRNFSNMSRSFDLDRLCCA